MKFTAELHLTLEIEARDREEALRIAEGRRREIEAAFPARVEAWFTPMPEYCGPFRHAPCIRPPKGYPTKAANWIGPIT